MVFILGLLIFSFITTSILIVPFINFLYAMRFRRAEQKTIDAFGERTPIFDKFHNVKAGVPVGGGLLIILVVSILFMLIFPVVKYMGISVTGVYDITTEINILFFTFLSFGLLGLYDDVKKFFQFKKENFFGLRMKHKLVLQILLATVIACMLHFQLGISFLNIPFIGTFHLGWMYIPFAVFVIVAFTNAVNITDGLDGLAAGILMIAMFGLWYLSATILDVPLSMLLALWLGSLVAFLYFNIFPARLFMGDVGALAFADDQRAGQDQAGGLQLVDNAVVVEVGAHAATFCLLAATGFSCFKQRNSPASRLSSSHWFRNRCSSALVAT
jgi:phospho-N-acetylmuramoyl-pentapeptide-transferase